MDRCPHCGRKQYRRANSFSDEEIATIWRVRHLPAKEVLHLFPNRNVEMINHLRAKTGAYRIYGANKR